MIKLKINGQERNWDGDPDLPLLWFLRDETGLTGTKYGCGQALCGACTVIVDKQAIRALELDLLEVADSEISGHQAAVLGSSGPNEDTVARTCAPR